MAVTTVVRFVHTYPESPHATPDGDRVASLTDRELHVLELVATGKTNQAIAHALRVSPRTVAKHLEHIYRKLDVGNRAAAVARLAAL